MAPPRWEEKRRRVALAGVVVEKESGRPVAGAEVAIESGPAAFEELRALAPARATTTSAADGHFHFLDLPGGTYTVAATVPGTGERFGVARERTRVRVSREGAVTIGTLALALPTTRITGRVTTADGTPVPLAEVRVAGGGDERVLTDSDGRFELAVSEVGGRRLDVSARGFQHVRTTVQLTRRGTGKAANVTLTPEPR